MENLKPRASIMFLRCEFIIGKFASLVLDITHHVKEIIWNDLFITWFTRKLGPLYFL